MKESKKKLVVYLRADGTRQQAEEQLADLQNYADAKGFEVVKTYTEIVSASNPVDGAVFWSMMDDIQGHDLDALLVRDETQKSHVLSKIYGASNSHNYTEKIVDGSDKKTLIVTLKGAI